MARCASCDYEYDDTVASCPECEAAAETFRCERCTQEYHDADACPACGALRLAVPCDEHPEQGAEGRCVFCGRAICDGPAPGRDDPWVCEEHRAIPLIGGWAQVYSTTGEFEAQLLRENLRAEGVEAQIYSQKDHMYPVDFGELSIVRLMVPVWEYNAALGIIRSHMDREGEVVFACPSCGEAYEAGDEACSACGGSLVA
jgi:predicted RNA-binding Zn-ribbon protein involved in translation (DUF1610 family)